MKLEHLIRGVRGLERQCARCGVAIDVLDEAVVQAIPAELRVAFLTRWLNDRLLAAKRAGLFSTKAPS